MARRSTRWHLAGAALTSAAVLYPSNATPAATAGASAAATGPHAATAQGMGGVHTLLQKRSVAARDALRGDIASGRVKEGSPVNTTYGPVVGLTGSDGVDMWLGVPFAAPPVGNLRWRPPQPPTPWNTPLSTQWWGPACVQADWYWGLMDGFSEDCLTLNVYAPSGSPPPGGWPTMVFLYGGSWVYGSSDFPLYWGNSDVKLTNDTIIVTTNYRLNVFGFLAGDLLRAESQDGSVGNYGFQVRDPHALPLDFWRETLLRRILVQDQRAALQWVQDNIANFGGDPSRVTLFGESAGGGSTSDHLVSPRSAGLFSRAIIESGAFSDWSSQPYYIAATRLPTLLNNTGCASAADPLACVRALNTSVIFAAKAGMADGLQQFSPVIDGVELPDDPRVLLAQGKVAPVPILLGFNKDEGTVFNSAPTSLNASQYVNAIADLVGAELAPAIAAQYPPENYKSPWWAISALMGDSQMGCPAKRTAAALTNSTIRPVTMPVYVYYYTHVFLIIDIIDLFKPQPMGCFHGSELFNVFDFELMLLGPGEPDLAKQFVRYWTRFAASGNPNGGSDPVWQQYGSATQDEIATIGTGATGVTVQMVTGLKNTECAFWNTVTIPPSVIWG